ncbi:hypothetical protein CYMTET_16770 [Cymbomonas tetramitiformis]|uniref:Uncharacterized protein n=1 Tax=Cymbomonas tetramitiformis TaxID=36881 RepID=A0AAE0GBJ2_9CHLO|nr:hypothetical protein CYMTET_16770 [Cymbomonas tetramitiformis]|eukprot:gene2835-biopygen2777
MRCANGPRGAHAPPEDKSAISGETYIPSWCTSAETQVCTRWQKRYIAFLRGSAVIWHAHLHKCPDANLDSLPEPRKESWLEGLPAGKALFREDAVPGTGDKAANNKSIGKQRGVLDAAAKAFNGD